MTVWDACVDALLSDLGSLKLFQSNSRNCTPVSCRFHQQRYASPPSVACRTASNPASVSHRRNDESALLMARYLRPAAGSCMCSKVPQSTSNLRLVHRPTTFKHFPRNDCNVDLFGKKWPNARSPSYPHRQSEPTGGLESKYLCLTPKHSGDCGSCTAIVSPHSSLREPYGRRSPNGTNSTVDSPRFAESIDTVLHRYKRSTTSSPVDTVSRGCRLESPALKRPHLSHSSYAATASPKHLSQKSTLNRHVEEYLLLQRSDRYYRSNLSPSRSPYNRFSGLRGSEIYRKPLKL